MLEKLFRMISCKILSNFSYAFGPRNINLIGQANLFQLIEMRSRLNAKQEDGWSHFTAPLASSFASLWMRLPRVHVSNLSNVNTESKDKTTVKEKFLVFIRRRGSLHTFRLRLLYLLSWNLVRIIRDNLCIYSRWLAEIIETVPG